MCKAFNQCQWKFQLWLHKVSTKNIELVFTASTKIKNYCLFLLLLSSISERRKQYDTIFKWTIVNFQVVANKKPNLLVGSLICGAIPIRDPHNKWYCPDYMFSRKVYPNYLSGTSYLMSRSTALSLYEAAPKVPIFHLEDIYVSGILAEQVSQRLITKLKRWITALSK